MAQGGSRNQIADVVQSGLRNTATINQDDSNVATVLQDGMGSFTDENTVLINQDGRSNMAIAEQHGDKGNSLSINQEGSGFSGVSAVNKAIAIQTGSFNTATISQQP